MTIDNDNQDPPGSTRPEPERAEQPANTITAAEMEKRFNIARAATMPQDNIAVLAGAVGLLELSADPHDRVLATNIRRCVKESFTARSSAYGSNIVGKDGRPLGAKPKLVLS